jgi:hypothetical protein
MDSDDITFNTDFYYQYQSPYSIITRNDAIKLNFAQQCHKMLIVTLK